MAEKKKKVEKTEKEKVEQIKALARSQGCERRTSLWERIARTRYGCQDNSGGVTHRLAAPGGWVYRNVTYSEEGGVSQAMCFVPYSEDLPPLPGNLNQCEFCQSYTIEGCLHPRPQIEDILPPNFYRCLSCTQKQLEKDR